MSTGFVAHFDSGTRRLALLAFSIMEITGFFAFIGLWQMRSAPKLPAWNATAILLLAVITFGVVSVAANEGGRIRHPEIQSAEDIATAQAAARVPTARAIGAFVISKTWLWPACETLHFVGLSLLFVAVLFINLRVLGFAKSVSFCRGVSAVAAGNPGVWDQPGHGHAVLSGCTPAVH